MDICIHNNCTRKARSRGICSTHYTEAKNAGTLDSVALPKRLAHYISNVNDEAKTGTCSICGADVSVIYQNKGKYTRWQCRNKEQERWLSRGGLYKYGDNKTIPREKANAARAKLTVDQNNRCAICGSSGDDRKLSLDHCHSTGKIRGLICRTCNTGLGMFSDDTALLQTAINYLNQE